MHSCFQPSSSIRQSAPKGTSLHRTVAKETVTGAGWRLYGHVNLTDLDHVTDGCQLSATCV
jgi:hypothetical protein